MFTLFLLPFKILRTFLRFAGVRGALLLVVGVAIGMLIAPTSGARLRAKLQARMEAAGVPLPTEPTPTA